MTRGDEGHDDILASRAQLQADLGEWTERYPIVDPARLPAVGLTTAVLLPWARREDRALAARMALWIIAFDALVDEGEASPAALAGLAARYGTLGALGDGDREWTARPAGDNEGQLDAALREIAAQLAHYNPPPALWSWWATSCRATIAAIVRQRELGRAGEIPPGYAAALPLLLDSIGVRPYLALGAIVGREPGLAARLPAVTALASKCALAIRLANDLRTWEKDEREGGYNTLVAERNELARLNPGLSATAAHELALGAIKDRLVASCARCQAGFAAPGETGRTEAAMSRLVAATVGIYATHDFHTFPDLPHQR